MTIMTMSGYKFLILVPFPANRCDPSGIKNHQRPHVIATGQ